jgi:hypothetical protein
MNMAYSMDAVLLMCRTALFQHMAAAQHCTVDRSQSFWSAAEYFFPSLENDPLLCELVPEEDEEQLVCSSA